RRGIVLGEIFLDLVIAGGVDLLFFLTGDNGVARFVAALLAAGLVMLLGSLFRILLAHVLVGARLIDQHTVDRLGFLRIFCARNATQRERKGQATRNCETLHSSSLFEFSLDNQRMA